MYSWDPEGGHRALPASARRSPVGSAWRWVLRRIQPISQILCLDGLLCSLCLNPWLGSFLFSSSPGPSAPLAPLFVPPSLASKSLEVICHSVSFRGRRKGLLILWRAGTLTRGDGQGEGWSICRVVPPGRTDFLIAYVFNVYYAECLSVRDLSCIIRGPSVLASACTRL